MEIQLEGQDLLFAKIAQGAKVGSATLPSGLKVPDGDWVIKGDQCVKSINIDSSILNDAESVHGQRR